MSTTSRQNDDFLNSVIGTGLLESSIEWIKDNIGMEGLYSESELLEYARNFAPEDVFKSIDLDAWAESNGYVKE